MAVAIKIPSLGESISEGTIARWLKKSGESVKANEPLFELETDKATSEIPAPASGTLVISVQEGQTIPIGATVGQIEAGAASTTKSDSKGADTSAKGGKQAPAAPPRGNNQESKPAPPRSDVTSSPAARQIAADANLDLSRVAGSGRGGLITKEDVLSLLEQKTPAPAAPPESPPPAPPVSEAAPPAPGPVQSLSGRETRQRMSTIRQRIAERLVAAQQTAAILTTFNEADLSAVMALRSRYKETFQKKYEVGLGFMSFFVKACVEALKAFPNVNGRIDGGDIVLAHFYHIGVAVSSDKGLMVPVLRDVDRLTFAQIEKAIVELADKARSGKIAVADLQGGTFTITNGGIFGSLLSTPLLNPPQSAILGMHAIQKRPVVVDDQVVIRPMMYLALSYDHRLIDGREAVSFLVRVKECIENPERLLLEV
ncbi:MAG: 2-oxoglutarate dehydrogenase complex dihydrolipoyllysine-residue succinyltransferase [Gemmataceae bacterium]